MTKVVTSPDCWLHPFRYVPERSMPISRGPLPPHFTAQTANGIKNVVLVHGGFVDGSGWQGVYDGLKKDGYAVFIVQNRTISLADDVAVPKRMLAAQSGSVILVGH